MTDEKFNFWLGYGMAIFMAFMCVFPIAMTIRERGSQGNPCYPNRTCDDGMKCYDLGRHLRCFNPGDIKEAK